MKAGGGGLASLRGTQFARYVAVGAWNTLFGYGVFALLTAVLEGRFPYAYLAAWLLSNLVSITVAFLGYKWFVFRTKGNYFREWFRCVGVYSGALVLGLLALPVLALLLRHTSLVPKAVPYVAGAAVTGVTVVVSFLGHKHISFSNSPRR